ncbi:MAG: type II toxin-antitoxin system VapC family toxin [Victivallales bacterium]
MKEYLLDTHTYLWFISDDPRLSRSARKLIESEGVFYISMASLWEITIKSSLGKLKIKDHDIRELLEKQIVLNDFKILNISPSVLVALHELPFKHGDPFDRLIIAQALEGKMPIIGADGIFKYYGVELIS